MRGFQIIVSGNWAHFKKPETNNNPLSHDLITKTALIGLIGAVIGIERKEMRDRFPLLCEDLLYGVQLLNPVKKFSWGFTSKTAINPTAAGSPKYFEFLKNPSFKTSICLNNYRSENDFHCFSQAVKNGESIYPPSLGWHNCPADLYFESEGEFEKKEIEVFETKSFVSTQEHTPKELDKGFRIGFEKLPTYQNNEFWNLPEKYVSVIYPDVSHSLKVEGSYYEYIGINKEEQNVKEQWYLI